MKQKTEHSAALKFVKQYKKELLKEGLNGKEEQIIEALIEQLKKKVKEERNEVFILLSDFFKAKGFKLNQVKSIEGARTVFLYMPTIGQLEDFHLESTRYDMNVFFNIHVKHKGTEHFFTLTKI